MLISLRKTQLLLTFLYGKKSMKLTHKLKISIKKYKANPPHFLNELKNDLNLFFNNKSEGKVSTSHIRQLC